MPAGARCVLWFLLDIIRILKGKLSGWFISVFSGYPQSYPQGCPQGSLGLIWVNMGFDVDQLFAFGWHYLCFVPFGTPLVLHRAPQLAGASTGLLYIEWLGH